MKGNRFYYLILIYAALAFLLGTGAVAAKEGGKIIHDAEYYILNAQNGEKWAADDKKIDKKLALFLRVIQKSNNCSLTFVPQSKTTTGRRAYFQLCTPWRFART